MATMVKPKFVNQHGKRVKKGMSAARRAHLSKLAKQRWAVKRQAEFDQAKATVYAMATPAPTPPVLPTMQQRKDEARLSIMNAVAQMLTSTCGIIDNLHGV